MTAAIDYAASALAQTLIKPEYAMRVVGFSRHRTIPAGYHGACTIQEHGFFYSFWFNHATGEVLLRIEGLGLFETAYEDDDPAVVAAVVYHIPHPEGMPETLANAA